MIRICKSVKMTVMILLIVGTLAILSACGSGGGSSTTDNPNILIILHSNYDDSITIPLHVRRGIMLSLILQSTIKRDGYTLKYWTTDKEGVGVQFLPNSHIWYHINLYAQWEPVGAGSNYSAADYHAQYTVKVHLADDNYLCFSAPSGSLIKDHITHYMSNYRYSYVPTVHESDYQNSGQNNIKDKGLHNRQSVNQRNIQDYKYCKGSFVMQGIANAELATNAYSRCFQDAEELKSAVVSEEKAICDYFTYYDDLHWSTEPNGGGVVLDEQSTLGSDLVVYPTGS